MKKKVVINEITIKKETPKVVSKWLEKHFSTINKIYKDKKKIIELLGELKFQSDIDGKWYQNFMAEVKKRKDVDLLKYLYDIFLSGEKLVVDYTEGETPLTWTEKKAKFKKIKKK